MVKFGACLLDLDDEEDNLGVKAALSMLKFYKSKFLVCFS